MIRRTFAALLTLAGCLALAGAAEPTKQQKQAKEALQAVGEFVGTWKGSAQKEGAGKNAPWKETITVGWRFEKSGDTAIVVSFENSKAFKDGELKFAPAKKQYALALTTAADADQLFLGEFKKGRLELVAVDAKSKDKSRLTLSTNNDGARLVYDLAVQPKGKGVFKKALSGSLTKEGEALASGSKQECIVTGGLGTMTVSYMGKTYYVCCSGCRDAFNESPAQFVKEWEEKQKKK